MTNPEMIEELKKIMSDETYSPYTLINELIEKLRPDELEDNTL